MYRIQHIRPDSAPTPGARHAHPGVARALLYVALGLATVAASACAPGGAPVARGITPVYDKTTGRLLELLADRDGDGRPDTHAFFDGARLLRIEIDRDGDGVPDRWEYYAPVPDGSMSVSSIDGRTFIERAEQLGGTHGRVTEREFYVNGDITRVEQDRDDDGRVDTWEFYREGELQRLELDLLGKGYADRRLIYGPGGGLRGVQVDPDGDGKFDLVSGVAAPDIGRKGG